MSSFANAFLTTVDVSCRATCLILVVLVLRRAVRQQVGSRVLFWAWLLVVARLAVPLTLSTDWSPFRTGLINLPAASSSAASRAADETVAMPTARVAVNPSLASGVAPTTAPGLSATEFAASIWLLGTAVLLLVRAIAQVRFRRAIRRRAVLAGSPEAEEALRFVRRLAGPKIEVVLTDAIASPALCGVLRPRLLLPRSFLTQLTRPELRLAVAHEVTHHHRRDLWAQALLQAATIVHWFNPVLWLVRRPFRDDCELACDEAVVQSLRPDERESYGSALLRILRLTTSRPVPRFGLGIVESKQQIQRRIEMISAEYASSRVRAACACVLFAGLAAVSLTRESHAESTPVGEAAGKPKAERKIAPTATVAEVAALDTLDQLFPNGVVAAVGDKSVTVADVRREMAPLLPQLRGESKAADELKQRVLKLQNQIVSNLVGRNLLIKEFNTPGVGEPPRHVAAEWVDKAIAERVQAQFGNDREKFLAYLKEHGWTLESYRKEVEEEIMYGYMRAQERKLDPAKRKVADDRTGQIHLRLIQLARSDGVSDAVLLDEANAVLARLKAGERFEDVAKQVSTDGRRSKGGDWGWLRPSDLRPEYRDVAFALKSGEVSAPLVRPEGCFLFYVQERG